MSGVNSWPVRQMRFVASDGRREVLWVSPTPDGFWTILERFRHGLITRQQLGPMPRTPSCIAAMTCLSTRAGTALNVPVWQYGVSVGSVVNGNTDEDGKLRFGEVIRDSPGATVRFIVPEDDVASDVYFRYFVRTRASGGFGYGPATFYDPGIVALNIHERFKLTSHVERYMDRLVAEGIITQWEIGDPDPEPINPSQPPPPERDDELVHDRPAQADMRGV